MPHHRFLAFPARRQRLTSRLLAAWQGGGGWPHHRLLAGRPSGAYIRSGSRRELTRGFPLVGR